jgi:hypothetical protein
MGRAQYRSLTAGQGGAGRGTYSVCPLVFTRENSTENTRRNELAHDPAEVHVRAEVSTQRYRTHFGGVGGGESLEDTPGDTAQDLTNEKCLHVVGEERDEDEGNHQRERDDHGLAVAILFRNNTVDEETDDFPTEGAIAESGFPGGRHCVFSGRKKLAVFLVELGQSVERAEKDNVVTLHDNSSRKKNRPANSLWIELDGLPEAHIVLFCRGVPGFVGHVGKVFNCHRCFSDNGILSMKDIPVLNWDFCNDGTPAHGGDWRERGDEMRRGNQETMLMPVIR